MELKKRSLNAKQLIGEINQEKQQKKTGEFSFVIDVDDACCLDGLNDTCDYGGKQDGVLDAFESFSKLNPHLKYTFFTIPKPTFLRNGEVSGVIKNPEIYNIQKNKKSRFVKYLIEKQTDKTIEVAVHGLSHHQEDIANFHRYAEFEFCDMDVAIKKIIDAKNTLLSAGLRVNGWKPPGWSFGSLLKENNELIEEVFKNEFRYIKISSPQSGLNRKQWCASHLYVTRKFGVYNIPQNINLTWSKKEIIEVALAIAEKGGIICPQFHFTPKTKVIEDGVCDEIFEKIEILVEKLGINKSSTERIKTNLELIV